VNLPKITPPFSIVDSILPQLEEIDRTARAKRPNRLAGGWNRFRKSISVRTMGGLAAACIILALVIVQGPSMLGSDQSANEDALMDSKAANSESEQNNDQYYSVNFSDNSADNAAPANQEEKSDSDDALLRRSSEELDESPAEEPSSGDGRKGSVSTEEVERGIEGSGQAGGGSTGTEGAGVDMGPTLTSSGNNGESVNDVSFNEQPAQTEEKQPERITGFTANIIQNVAVSPDGLLEAFVENTADGLQVIVANQEQERIYASPLKKADAVGELTWSADGAKLTYKVTTGNSSETYTIDIATRSEKQN